MSPIGTEWSSLLIILAVAFLAHEPWRWLGAAVGRSLREEDAVFQWVRAVSTALVAALVARLVLFPAGVLEDVALWIRLAAFVIGCAGYFATGRNLGLGIVSGCGAIMVLLLAA